MTLRVPAFAEPFRSQPFRLYFGGQVLSHTGTWFQNLAIALVVLEQTGSAQALSLVTVAQFTPIFLLGFLAGRICDRFAPRTVLLWTSVVSGLVVGSIAVVIAAGGDILVPALVLLFVLGCAGAFDRVAAQAVIYSLVGAARLSRAAAIGTMANSVARAVGPGLAGLAFQGLGPAWCMAINAASYAVVTASLLCIRRRDLHPLPAGPERSAPAPRVLGVPGVRTLLVVNAGIAFFALALNVVMTSTVSLDFGGDAAAVGLSHALNAVGAVAGGLVGAARGNTRIRALPGALAVFAVAYAAGAASPTLAVFLVVCPLLGFGIAYYLATVASVAQSVVPPDLIGRMMSLVTIGQFGVLPISALVAGAVIDAASGRAALAVGGTVAVVCLVGVVVRLLLAREGRRTADGLDG